MGSTRRQSRQLVNHGHILVNGKRVDIASYRVKQGDVIELKENSKGLKVIEESLGQKSVPTWLELQADKKIGRVLENPTRDVVDFELDEAMIIEFYSR